MTVEGAASKTSTAAVPPIRTWNLLQEIDNSNPLQSEASTLNGGIAESDLPTNIYDLQANNPECVSVPGQDRTGNGDLGLMLSSLPDLTSEDLQFTAFGPNTGAASSENGCKCLSSLYSTLSSFQHLPPPSFPYSMGVLTKATAVARDALRCQRCPTLYTTALQNLMSLCTLLPVIAHEYGKLLQHVDERSSRGEYINFRMGEN